jgi:uncharacterized cupredoxin-like copper-binding protein
MPRRPARSFAALVSGVALLTSACALPDLVGNGSDARSRGGRTAASTRPATVSPRKTGPTRATGATVPVVMNDRFRYRPDAITVRAGRTVTFAVTNAGKLPHEFILGDEAAQLDHERRMQTATTGRDHAHTHGDHATPAGTGALTVPPGQTKRLTWIFDEPGIVLYGCHVVGHWAAGMKGTIVVVARGRRPWPGSGNRD